MKRTQRNKGGKTIPSPAECLFHGEPDPFEPGAKVNIEGAKMRVIGADKESVYFAVAGHPVEWKREWLENLPTSSIFFKN